MSTTQCGTITVEDTGGGGGGNGGNGGNGGGGGGGQGFDPIQFARNNPLLAGTVAAGLGAGAFFISQRDGGNRRRRPRTGGSNGR